MPIYSLEGTPGSGKTLYCVQKIIPEFLKIRDSQGNLVPRHIYTNIEGLKPEIICSLAGIPYECIADYFHVLGQRVDENGRTYEDKDLIRYWYYQAESIEWIEVLNGNRTKEKIPDPEKAKLIPIGSLVIIDEIQNYYSNRDFATVYSKQCIDYITKNRHYGWTLWWMSQSVESVDVTFRRNTQYVYFLERKEIYGSSNTSSVKMYEGWLVGDKVNTPPFAVKTFRFDKAYFQAYSSYVQGVTEEKRYKTNVFLQHKGFMTMLILFLIGIVYLFFNPPLETLDKSMKKTNKFHSTATATDPPKHLSFSGVSGGAVVPDDEKKENETPCYVNKFVSFGEVYVVLQNGNTYKVNVGEKYEKCK